MHVAIGLIRMLTIQGGGSLLHYESRAGSVVPNLHVYSLAGLL